MQGGKKAPLPGAGARNAVGATAACALEEKDPQVSGYFYGDGAYFNRPRAGDFQPWRGADI